MDSFAADDFLMPPVDDRALAAALHAASREILTEVKALRQAMESLLGIQLDDPESINEWRADWAYTRAQRRTSEERRKTAATAGILAAVAAAGAVVAAYFGKLLHFGPPS